jgi:hypothetical protein
VARLSDGSLLAWGSNVGGQCKVRPPPAGQAYVRCAAGAVHTLGLLSNGTILACGGNFSGQCDVPSPPPGLVYTDVAAGSQHSIGRLSDGSIVVWGGNLIETSFVPRMPAGYRCAQIAGGEEHSMALLEPTYSPFCYGDGSAGACPCANSGSAGHGCENSAATGGARLSATGAPALQADDVQLTSSGELSQSLSIMLQGSGSIAPASFGDGLRCVGGSLKRLYVHTAVNGSVTAPQAGEPSISARSAALGDTIPPGATRYYQVYYRDALASFCPAPQGSTFNVSNGLAVEWAQ